MAGIVNDERELVRKKILDWYEKDVTKNIKIEMVEDKFAIGNVYYAEFSVASPIDEDEEDDTHDKKANEAAIKKDPTPGGQMTTGADAEEWEVDFFYALVRGDEVQLYDDGVEVIRALNIMLERKRTFSQRFSDFSLVDAVGALIAAFVTMTFVLRYALASRGIAVNDTIDKDLVSIFTVIVGYYFGRVSSVVADKKG